MTLLLRRKAWTLSHDQKRTQAVAQPLCGKRDPFQNSPQQTRKQGLGSLGILSRLLSCSGGRRQWRRRDDTASGTVALYRRSGWQYEALGCSTRSSSEIEDKHQGTQLGTPSRTPGAGAASSAGEMQHDRQILKGGLKPTTRRNGSICADSLLSMYIWQRAQRRQRNSDYIGGASRRRRLHSP